MYLTEAKNPRKLKPIKTPLGAHESRSIVNLRSSEALFEIACTLLKGHLLGPFRMKVAENIKKD